MKVIAVIGDSICASLLASDAAHTLEGQLMSLRPDWRLRICSVVAQAVQLHPGFSHVQAALSGGGFQLHPDLYVVTLGVNDYGAGGNPQHPTINYANFIQRAGQLLDQLTNAPKLWVLPIWHPGADVAPLKLNTEGKTLCNYREAIFWDVCQPRGVPCLDGRAAIPHELRHYGDGSDRDVHPNVSGTLKMAEWLAGAVAPYVGG